MSPTPPQSLCWLWYKRKIYRICSVFRRNQLEPRQMCFKTYKDVIWRHHTHTSEDAIQILDCRINPVQSDVWNNRNVSFFKIEQLIKPLDKALKKKVCMCLLLSITIWEYVGKSSSVLSRDVNWAKICNLVLMLIFKRRKSAWDSASL